MVMGAMPSMVRSRVSPVPLIVSACPVIALDDGLPEVSVKLSEAPGGGRTRQRRGGVREAALGRRRGDEARPLRKGRSGQGEVVVPVRARRRCRPEAGTARVEGDGDRLAEFIECLYSV